MNTTYEDLSPKLPDHVQDVMQIAMALMPFHKKREETYKLSFARRGESGVWQNLMRKTDRIDGLCNNVFSGKEGNNGVTLIDTLVDAAMYSLKWLAVIKQVRPEDLEMWIGIVFARETGIEVKEAMEMFGMWDAEGAAADALAPDIDGDWQPSADEEEIIANAVIIERPDEPFAFTHDGPAPTVLFKDAGTALKEVCCECGKTFEEFDTRYVVDYDGYDSLTVCEKCRNANEY